jgi:pimeloyl-ACP methyl ester carboxylesterase
MNLHYQAYGQGEPVIILHGLLGSSDNWKPIAARLGECFGVFALDQRNHGRSPHSQQMNYPLMAQDILEFLAQHHLERAHVIGHSMGGKTAMELALRFTEKVGKLIVVDISPRAYHPHHEPILAALMALEPSSYLTRQQIEDALAPAIPDLALRRFLLKNLARNSDGRFSWRIGLHEIHQNYSRLCEALTSDRAFEKPTLFIRGESSHYLTEQDTPFMRGLFPHAIVQSIPDAAHWVHVENAPAFIQAVIEFLQIPRSTFAN